MKYRKKPVVIEAEVYKPGMEDAFWCIDLPGIYCTKEHCILPDGEGKESAECSCRIPIIKTLEGDHQIMEGDYNITGVAGERYPCKPDIFKQTYEPVE